LQPEADVNIPAPSWHLSFMLGLSHGFGIEPLAIQYGNGPAPLDYRDFITNSTFRGETERHVEKYCGDTLVWNQKGASRDRRTELGHTIAALCDVIRVSKRVTNAVDLRSKLTNIMFENPIRQLRDAVVSFNDFLQNLSF
jgi:hypothetical protein